jgi:uridine kinase
MPNGGRTIEHFADLADRIRQTQPRLGRVRLVAVDGPGGAGKSVFAERLAAALGDTPIAHTDDFASWENPLRWWDGLEAHVLHPLQEGRPAHYRAYDWTGRGAGEWREIPAADAVILEGVSSSRRVVTPRLSFAVWIDTPRDLRLARGIERDGAAMRGHWDAWMAEEDGHFEADGARGRADLVVDGAPTLPHDSTTTFVRITQFGADLHAG